MKFSSAALFALTTLATLGDVTVQAGVVAVPPQTHPAEILEWATSGCPVWDSPHHWWPKATISDTEVLCGGAYDAGKAEADRVCLANGGKLHAGIDAVHHGDEWCAFPRNDPIINGKPACPTPYHYAGVKNGKIQCHGTWNSGFSQQRFQALCPEAGGTWIPLDYWENPYTCEMGAAPTPTASGDPHFVTWTGEKFDFHGGCDLVLLQNPNFANGLGMNVHVRTQIKTWWSYIESAILQLGDNTLQITGGAGSGHYSLNGAEMSEIVTGDATLGDFAIHFRRVNDHHTITRIDLGNHGDAIGIETYKDFVKVNVKNVKNTSFDGSSGMLGSYPDGKKIGRDGKTVFEDVNEFGQEWMVGPSDTILFSNANVGDLPLKCAMPKDTTKEEKRRRLGEGAITEEDAAIACSHVEEFNKDACIFDVMATNDKDMAGSY